MAETTEKDLVGRTVESARGDRVGRITRILTHGDDEQWASVRLGILGLHSVIVPLKGSEEDGRRLRVPYEIEWIKQSPHVEVEDERLSDESADTLHGHYGLERVIGATSDSEEVPELPRETREATPPAMEGGEDSPLNQRRRERMEELDIPGYGDRERDEDAPEPDESE